MRFETRYRQSAVPTAATSGSSVPFHWPSCFTSSFLPCWGGRRCAAEQVATAAAVFTEVELRGQGEGGWAKPTPLGSPCQPPLWYAAPLCAAKQVASAAALGH